MRFACWITKAANTDSEYVILIAFPLQQWLHERTSVLRYTNIACRYILRNGREEKRSSARGLIKCIKFIKYIKCIIGVLSVLGVLSILSLLNVLSVLSILSVLSLLSVLSMYKCTLMCRQTQQNFIVFIIVLDVQ